MFYFSFLFLNHLKIETAKSFLWFRMKSSDATKQDLALETAPSLLLVYFFSLVRHLLKQLGVLVIAMIILLFFILCDRMNGCWKLAMPSCAWIWMRTWIWKKKYFLLGLDCTCLTKRRLRITIHSNHNFTQHHGMLWRQWLSLAHVCH